MRYVLCLCKITCRGSVLYCIPCLSTAFQSVPPQVCQWPMELRHAMHMNGSCWHANILEVLGIVINLPSVYVVVEACSPVPASTVQSVTLRRDADIMRCSTHCLNSGLGLGAPSPQSFVAGGQDPDSAAGCWDLKLVKLPVLTDGAASEDPAFAPVSLQQFREGRWDDTVDGIDRCGSLVEQAARLMIPLSDVYSHEIKYYSSHRVASKCDGDESEAQAVCQAPRIAGVVRYAEPLRTSDTQSLGKGEFAEVVVCSEYCALLSHTALTAAPALTHCSHCAPFSFTLLSLCPLLSHTALTAAVSQ